MPAISAEDHLLYYLGQAGIQNGTLSIAKNKIENQELVEFPQWFVSGAIPSSESRDIIKE